jgi:pimeloyl-ACP methyl ester carboxylesterase
MSMRAAYETVGIVFVGPIIGMPPSLLQSFAPLTELGIAIEGVDIFEGQTVQRNMRTVLGMTMLPGAHKRRVRFANAFDEALLFGHIRQRIERLKERGRTRLIFGGMSGGFIFASRLVQSPPDAELDASTVSSAKSAAGLFGVSPLVFYPPEVTRLGADLALVPSGIPTTLIWGDGDDIVPDGTIEKCESVARQHPDLRCQTIRGPQVGVKEGRVKHQFFGGRDFIGPLKNAFWNERAERLAIEEIRTLIDKALTKGN